MAPFLLAGLLLVVTGLVTIARAGRDRLGVPATTGAFTVARAGSEAKDAAGEPGPGRLDVFLAAVQALLLGGLLAAAVLFLLPRGQELPSAIPQLFSSRQAQRLSLTASLVGWCFLMELVLAGRRPARRRLSKTERRLLAVSGPLALVVWLPLLVALLA